MPLPTAQVTPLPNPNLRAVDLIGLFPPAPAGSASLPSSNTELRAVDLIDLFPLAPTASKTSGLTSHRSPSSTFPSTHTELRAVELVDRFPPSSPSPSSHTALRAVDLISHFPPASTSSTTPRLTVKLPRRAYRRSPALRAGCGNLSRKPPIDFGLTDIMEVDEPDSKMLPPSAPLPPSPPNSDLVFNTAPSVFKTGPSVAPRQTSQQWEGTYRGIDWICPREELHLMQVLQDRALPTEMAAYPSFVSHSFRT